MQRISSRLAFVFVLTSGLGAAAQGPYLVDGVLGVDAPGNGVPGMPPWRTIGYALAHAAPPPAGAASVFVQGGQVYSAPTNGESFPIDVPPWVAVEGIAAGAGVPVLLPQPGDVALRLAAATDYGNAHTLLRWLVVQGGDVGLQFGASAGVAHRPLVEDCEFLVQATAGAQVNGDAGTDEPLLRRCHFAGTGAVGRGVQPLLLASNTTQTIALEQCRFDHLDAGVASDNHAFAIDHDVQDVRVDACQFETCTTALELMTPTAWSGPALDASCLVENTRIANCSIAVLAVTGGGNVTANRGITLRDSVIDSAIAGVRLANGGATASGTVSLTLERSTVAHCAVAIDLVDGTSAFTCAVALRDSHFLFDTTALKCVTSRFSTGNVSIERCRFLDGVYGIDAHFDCFSSTTTIASCLFARLTGTAIRYDGSYQTPQGPNNLAIHHATIADCNNGIEIASSGSQSAGDHLVLSLNSADLSIPVTPFAVFPISYSVSDTTALFGPTNLPMQDPQLVRPQYKLAPASPCRDAGVVTAATPVLDYEGDPRAMAPPGSPVLPDLGADEYAPGGSLRVYGTGGCGPLAVRPRIGSSSPGAAIGGAYEVDLAGGAAAGSPAPSFAILMTGFQDVPPAPLLDLAAIGMPGSYLWLDPTLLDGPYAVSASGAATVTLLAPSLPAFAGLALQHQWLVVLLAPYNLVTSDALRVTFDL